MLFCLPYWLCLCNFVGIWIKGAKAVTHKLFVFNPIKSLASVYLKLQYFHLHMFTVRSKLKHIKSVLGLPWWLSNKESACQCRRHEFNPWSEKIPNTSEQLSPHTTTTEPVLWSLGAAATEPNATTTEACVPYSLCSTTREDTATEVHVATRK